MLTAEILTQNEVLAAALGFQLPEGAVSVGIEFSLFNPTMRARRRLLGLTQKDLAKKVQMSLSTISHIESLRQFPNEAQATRIANVLGTDVDELFLPWLRLFQNNKEVELVTTSKEVRNAVGNILIGQSLILPLIDPDPGPQEVAEQNELRRTLEERLQILPPRHATVVRLRLGINEDAEQTFDQIGSLLNLTRERVSQIFAKALRILRQPQHSRHLHHFLPPMGAEWRRGIREQWDLVIGDRKTKTALKFAGAKLEGSEEGKTNIVLPKGWRRQGYRILDEKDRPRFRLNEEKLYAETRYYFYLYSPQGSDTVVGIIRDCDRSINWTEPFPLSDPNAYEKAHDEATEYLDLRYPGWREASAYWD